MKWKISITAKEVRGVCPDLIFVRVRDKGQRDKIRISRDESRRILLSRLFSEEAA